jgi:hypothetical protein
MQGTEREKSVVLTAIWKSPCDKVDYRGISPFFGMKQGKEIEMFFVRAWIVSGLGRWES